MLIQHLITTLLINNVFYVFHKIIVYLFSHIRIIVKRKTNRNMHNSLNNRYSIQNWIEKNQKEAWEKMGDTGNYEYSTERMNWNEENYWFGYFRALEDFEFSFLKSNLELVTDEKENSISSNNIHTLLSEFGWKIKTNKEQKKGSSADIYAEQESEFSNYFMIIDDGYCQDGLDDALYHIFNNDFNGKIFEGKIGNTDDFKIVMRVLGFKEVV